MGIPDPTTIQNIDQLLTYMFDRFRLTQYYPTPESRMAQYRGGAAAMLWDNGELAVCAMDLFGSYGRAPQWVRDEYDLVADKIAGVREIQAEWDSQLTPNPSDAELEAQFELARIRVERGE